MRTESAFTAPLPDREQAAAIEARFQKALEYFRRRGSVIFLSYCRFFEKHAQPQQSLAKLLVENGIEVTWIDGFGWRRYEPVIYFPSEKLHVRQMFELPGNSWPPVKRLNDRLHERAIRRLGKKALIWVQGGIQESLAARLRYIDVFSYFDDCHRHGFEGILCRKSSLILTQNSHALELLRGGARQRAQLALPPIEVAAKAFSESEPLAFPPGFPEQRMGYIGSFFPHDYDLDLFETFVRAMPHWGFFLMGRTNEEGERHLERLRAYPNFFSKPWVPRSQVASAWRGIDVTLLLYKECREQDGAFPTKILESLYFGVPAVATQLPKTADLEGFFPRSNFADRLQSLAEATAKMPAEQVAAHYRHFAIEMSPKLHLARVAEALTAPQ